MAVAMPDVESFLEIAKSSGVFREVEIDVLRSVAECASKPGGDGYMVIIDREYDKLNGFVIFGRTPLTDFAWDIYWLVVAKGSQGKGIGRKLLREAECEMIGHTGRVVIRVETSTRDEYAPARNFYIRSGFREAGLIEDFYSDNDGIVLYSKDIR